MICAFLYANIRYTLACSKPIDIEEEPEVLLAAVRYDLGLGVDTIVPPGNFEHFRFAVEHIDEMIDCPLSPGERSMLEERLKTVKDRPFLDIEDL